MYWTDLLFATQVEWGAATMVEAERLLLTAALEDSQNERFLLLSDRCASICFYSPTWTSLLCQSNRHWNFANAVLLLKAFLFFFGLRNGEHVFGLRNSELFFPGYTRGISENSCKFIQWWEVENVGDIEFVWSADRAPAPNMAGIAAVCRCILLSTCMTTSWHLPRVLLTGLRLPTVLQMNKFPFCLAF